MPSGGTYSKEFAGGTALQNRRQPAKTVSYDNTKRRAFSGQGEGKFSGLSAMGKSVSGGSMNTGGKKRPGRFGK